MTMNHVFEFRQKEGAYALYIDGQQTDLRIYAERLGDGPVMLSPDGRIVPSEVWYAEGGPYDRSRRSYATEEAALQEEKERIVRWFMHSQQEQYHYVPRIIKPVFKKTDTDRLGFFMGEGEEGVDTGFRFEKSGEKNTWNVCYDGEVWAVAKEWDALYSVMAHILLYVGPILAKGPSALREFTARYAWRDQDAAKSLFDQGNPTGFVIRPAGRGGFFCHYRADSPGEVFPTLAEAQIEAKLRYTKERFDSLMNSLDSEADFAENSEQ